jgi:hypothetical protein
MHLQQSPCCLCSLIPTRLTNKAFPLPAFKKLNRCQEKGQISSGRRSKRPMRRVAWINEDCYLDQNGTSTIEKLQTEDTKVMGSTKHLHGIDEGADGNALTMPTLPERNLKKRTFQLFCSMMALMTFLQQTTKNFLLIHSMHVMYFMQMKKKERSKTLLFVCCCGDMAL